MRASAPRFPFLITPFQGSLPGQPQDAATLEKLLKKIGLLESTLDEFLESRGPGDNLEDFFQQWIPVLDNLRFLQRAIETSGDQEWKKGMVMFYEKLLNLFLKFGFEPAAQTGTVFDPARHEAVETTVNPDLPPGTIADILLDGWIFKERVLRYAQVIVVKEK